MTQQHSENSVPSTTSSEYSLMELIHEMKNMGMDPKPLFEIAAQDISANHGEKGVIYSKSMLDQMILNKDTDGIYLWNELHMILCLYYKPDNTTIH